MSERGSHSGNDMMDDKFDECKKAADNVSHNHNMIDKVNHLKTVEDDLGGRLPQLQSLTQQDETHGGDQVQRTAHHQEDRRDQVEGQK